MDNLEISTSEKFDEKIGVLNVPNRRADPFISGRLLDLLCAQEDETYLDVGCRTGDYTVRFDEEGYRFYALEPSVKLLEQAKIKSRRIKWLNGSSNMIPAANQFFGGAVATLNVHHWQDLDKSFQELFRVLKNNSRLIIFTAIPDQMKSYWLNKYFPKMLEAFSRLMPSLNVLETAASKAGFQLIKKEKYFIPGNIQDQLFYAGKHDPEIYFDPSLREEMTSFTELSSEEEISSGLSRLRADLDNWEFERIKQQYDNESGDYLFLVFNKG